MKKKVFLRWSLLFLASNEKFAAIDDYTWRNTIKNKAKTLLTLAKELNLIDDEPDKPP